MKGKIVCSPLKIFKLIILISIKIVMSQLSISRLTEDLTAEFKNYKQINKINSTHFSCDEGNTILPYKKLNDDFCDCFDGSDENKTNACFNGKFICTNRFFEKIIISTNKVNDGICDCCDGSDEFPNLNCPKTCLDSSKKEFRILNSQFENIKSNINNFDKEKVEYFSNFGKNIIDEEIFRQEHLKELRKKKFLIKSYINKIENSLNDENIDYIDENEISYRNLIKTYSFLSEKIDSMENKKSSYKDELENIFNFSIFKDLSNELIKTNYKKYSCEFDFSKFKCKKENDWKSKHLGYVYFINLENSHLSKIISLNSQKGKLVTTIINHTKSEFFLNAQIKKNSSLLINMMDVLLNLSTTQVLGVIHLH